MKISKYLNSPGSFLLFLFLLLHFTTTGQPTDRPSIGVNFTFSSFDLNKTFVREIIDYDGDEITDELSSEELEELNKADFVKTLYSNTISVFSGYTGDSSKALRFGFEINGGIDLGNEKIVYDNNISGYHFTHRANAFIGSSLFALCRINERYSIMLSPTISYHFGDINNYKATEGDSIFGVYENKTITYDNYYSLLMVNTKIGLKYSIKRANIYFGPQVVFSNYELKYNKTIDDMEAESTTKITNEIEANNTSKIAVFIAADYKFSENFSGVINGSFGKDMTASIGIIYSLTK
jgi:hypothetical protein